MDTSDSLERWLRVLVSRGAADLFLVCGFCTGDPPEWSRDADCRSRRPKEKTSRRRCCPCFTRKLSSVTGPTGRPMSRCERPGVGRFRVNLHRERGRAAATIRALPATPPLLADLGLPSQVEQITRLHHGLVLVGGATGSGKTTTVAALVNEINRRDAKHIITIEDPIEFEHAHQKSVVEQVEIGIDAPDFPTALRAALRQAPDVIVIGEMRDPETMKIALTAGETGHLVFSTLHTTDVTSTVARVADSFPAGAAADDPPGPLDGARRGADADAAASRRRWPRAGRGAVDDWLRRAPAHPEERAAASPSGDHDDQA